MEAEGEYPQARCRAYAKGLRRAIENQGRHIVTKYEGRKACVMDELQPSADRFKEENTIRQLAGEVVRVEQGMGPHLGTSPSQRDVSVFDDQRD